MPRLARRGGRSEAAVAPPCADLHDIAELLEMAWRESKTMRLVAVRSRWRASKAFPHFSACLFLSPAHFDQNVHALGILSKEAA
jgi:hypothetical protein